jgi:hypothetical protein
MDALTADLQQLIVGKVDKVEHIKGLIDKLNADDCVEVGKYINERYDLIRSTAFSDLKDVWRGMLKGNKKDKTTKRMFIVFTRNGCERTFCVEKFAVKYVYAWEVQHGEVLKYRSVMFSTVQNMTRYYIE